MIPLVEQELTRNGILLSPETVSNIAAIAGVAPGPVGVNLAIAFGYELGGIPGLLAAALGVSLPSLILVMAVARVFNIIHNSNLFRSSMNGLKPVVVGITLYAAVSIAIKNGMMFSGTSAAIKDSMNFTVFNTVFNLPSLMIVAASFALLMKTKIHPIILILISAFAGIILF